MTEPSFHRSSLRGVKIFLSASVPSSERSVAFHGIPLDRAQTEVEQAVISVARAVYAAGGRIVCGGHPTITPILAIVAGEYVDTVAAEFSREADTHPDGGLGAAAPLIVHQLEAFRELMPAATHFLEELGQAQIVWHRVDPSEAGKSFPPDVPPYPRSLRRMRESMMEDAAIRAMVCIGGMEGVQDEATMFLDAKPRSRLYVFESTGGAAAMMAGQFKNVAERGGAVRIIDDEVLRSSHRADRNSNEELSFTTQFVPYPVIAQAIVRELAG
jgi:hypothetical protein